MNRLRTVSFTVSLSLLAAWLASCLAGCRGGDMGSSGMASGGANATSTGGVQASGGTAGTSASGGSGGAGNSRDADPAAGGAPSDGSGSSPVDTGGAPLDAPGDALPPSLPALPLPSRQEYLKTLGAFVDLLITTQINQPGTANDGALVSPSTNPEDHPIHSRAAEAVYPMAVLFKHRQDPKYADAAIRLGNWLIRIQNAAGAWVEEWPATTGWDGTSADQLISLAGAFVILKPRMTAEDSTRWTTAITRSADWIVANFPKGNINYVPTGAVALVLAARAVPSAKPAWATKATSLMNMVLAAINADGLLTGEGSGVDLGYNVAQSIGLIAAYGRLLPAPMYVDRAVQLQLAHLPFMYPNGAIDNSWGTRSYKWTLEGGTKTAPGVFLALGLLADKDPSIQRAAQLALAFLRTHALDEKGWIAYGPSAARHVTSSPPSNYSTFARAQSIAMAIEMGSDITSGSGAPIPAEKTNWSKMFPTISVGLVRTEKIMATISAYGAIGTYSRPTVVRGGSISALWFEGYGPTGFLQVSSQSLYDRVEAKHMPTEASLLPLTPRIETTSGALATNLYDDRAMLAVKTTADGAEAMVSGSLRDVAGAASGTTFSWLYQFGKDWYSKEATISTATGVRIVEPFVDLTGNQYQLVGTDSLRITTTSAGIFTVKVISSSGAYQLAAGGDRARHWSPFPGFDAYPLSITPASGATAPFKIKYTVTRSN